MAKASFKNTKYKALNYIIIILVVLVIIFKLDVFGLNDGNNLRNSNDTISFNNIDLLNVDECLSSLQGKWSITLNGLKKGQHINIRLLIEGESAKLYSKSEIGNWNMNVPNETFRIKIIAPMADCQYCQEFRRVDFYDIKENDDISGETSLASKLSGMKISKTGVEMISMMYKSGFHRGWK